MSAIKEKLAAQIPGKQQEVKAWGQGVTGSPRGGAGLARPRRRFRASSPRPLRGSHPGGDPPGMGRKAAGREGLFGGCSDR